MRVCPNDPFNHNILSFNIPNNYVRVKDMKTGTSELTFAPLPGMIALYHARGEIQEYLDMVEDSYLRQEK